MDVFQRALVAEKRMRELNMYSIDAIGQLRGWGAAAGAFIN